MGKKLDKKSINEVLCLKMPPTQYSGVVLSTQKARDKELKKIVKKVNGIKSVVKTDRSPVYESSSVVKEKSRQFMKYHGLKREDFANMLNVQTILLKRFVNGSTGHWSINDAYFAAYDFFERKRIALKEPK